MKTFFYTVERTAIAEFRDRGSRFVAYVFSATNPADVKQYLQQLKKEHPKAVHHCYAYRLGLDENNFRAVDDGEPAGTAGKPILGQIDCRELTNVCIIVVRYFGGTLLGVPGLISAYKTVSSLVLQVVPIVSKPILKHYTLEFDYTRMNDIMQVMRRCQGIVTEQASMLFCSMNAAVPLNHEKEFLYQIENIPGVGCKENEIKFL